MYIKDIMVNKEGINVKYVYLYSLYLLLSFVIYGSFTIIYDFVDRFKPEVLGDALLISIYIGGIVGSLLDSLIVKMPKRKRFIFANFLIFVSCIPMYWINSPYLIAICGSVLGIGLGLSTSIAPFYLNEVLPKEYSYQMLTGLGIALVFGNELISIIIYIVIEHELTITSALVIVGYFIPAFIAGVEIALGLIVFKSNTPIELCESMENDKCLIELDKIYTDPEKRVKEYLRISGDNALFKYGYPSYSRVFSSRHLKQTLKGIAMVTLHNFSGSFFMRSLSAIAYNSTLNFKVTTMVLNITKLLSTLIPFFLVDTLGMRSLMLGGFTGISILPLITLIIILSIGIEPGKSYPIAIDIITGLEFICDGVASCALPYIYSCKLLPERGFAIAMGSHWVSFSFIMLSFIYFTSGGYDPSSVYYGYMVMFIIMSLLTTFFIWFAIPKKKEFSDLTATIYSNLD